MLKKLIKESKLEDKLEVSVEKPKFVTKKASVQEIAHFFEPFKGKQKLRSKLSSQGPGSVNAESCLKTNEPRRQRLRNHPSGKTSAKLLAINTTPHKALKHLFQNKQKTAGCESDFEVEVESEGDIFFTPPNTPKRQTNDTVTKGGQTTKAGRMDKNEDQSKNDQTEEKTEVEMEETENQSFEMKTFYTGFKSIQADIKGLEEKVEKILAKQDSQQPDGEEVEKHFGALEKKIEAKSDEEKFVKLEKKVSDILQEHLREKRKSKILSGTIQHLAQMIGDLTRKVEMLELNNNKKQLSISGLIVKDTKKNNLIAEVAAFLDYELGVSVPIEDAYVIGQGSQGSPPQIIFTLQTMADKFLILNNKESLKNVLNEYSSPMYINEVFPAEISERKRREREIRKINKTLDQDEKIDIEFEKGKMLLNGSIYEKKIHEPTPEEILDLQPQEFDRIFNLPLSKQVTIIEKDSSFIGYTAAVSTHKEIQDLYLKTRLINAKARHVVCAYNIIGDQFYTDCDGCDDQEPGATKRILQLMRYHRIENRVFLIARYCGKEKLSAKRFECYLEVAKLALTKNSHNVKLNLDQKLTEENTKQTYNPQTTLKGTGSSWAARGARGALRGAQTGRYCAAPRGRKNQDSNTFKYYRGNNKHQTARHKQQFRGIYGRRSYRGGKRQRTMSEESGRLAKMQCSSQEDIDSWGKEPDWGSEIDQSEIKQCNGSNDEHSQTG